MVQDNEHVQRLIAARDREVARQRDLVQRLAEKHDRGDTENIREAFIKIQVIEAIERAVWHERDISGQKSEPFSPFVDFAASANVFDSDADIAKKAALLDHKTVVNCKSVLSRLAWLPLAGRGHRHTPRRSPSRL